MTIKKRWLIAIALLPFASCQDRIDAPAVEEPEIVEENENSSLVPGRVVVEFSEEMTKLVERDLASGVPAVTRSEPFNSALADLGAVSVERLYPDAGKWEPRHREAGLHRWYVIQYDENTPATKASVSLGDIPGVVYVEPVRKIHSTAYFNDPYLGEQWHYINDGSRSAWSKGCDINVLPVWKDYTCGSGDVIVSVEDEGVQADHPDLSGVVTKGGDTYGGSKNFTSGYVGYQIYPGDHGTHVAGTIGAINNNGKGLCGIAGGSDGKGGVSIMSCQIFMDDPSNPRIPLQGNTANAMVWACDHGAVISQNSWGHDYDNAEQARRGGVGSMKTAIDYFIKYAGVDERGLQTGPMKGGVVIFAAGNDNWPDGWPAKYSAEEPRCISVGSIGAAFKKASYSNYGDWVTVCAPGGDGSQAVYSTVVNGYGGLQGTSMACPHVSGVAALIVSYFGGPGFTNDMLVERLVGGANREAVKYQNVGPLVDALGAFSYGGKIAPEPVEDYSVEASSNKLEFSFKVTADEDAEKAYGFLLLASKNQSDLSSPDLRNLPSSVKKANVESGDLKVGDAITGTLTGLEFETVYYTTVVAYDYSNNYSSPAPVSKVSTKSNTPPVVTVVDYDGDFTVRAHETLRVSFLASEPDGHSFTVATEPGSGAASFVCNTDAEHNTVDISVIIEGKGAPAGKYTGHIIATDSYGAKTDYAFVYEILPNHPPVLISPLENVQFDMRGAVYEINMDEHISDPDGEKLSYEITTSGFNVVHLNPNGSTLLMTALGYGLVDVNIKAADTCGENVVFSFKALVRDSNRPADVYPNPVKNDLNVRLGKTETATVKVFSAAGAEVCAATKEISPFDPLTISMASCAPGVYTVMIKSASIDTSCQVVKL